MAQRQQARDEVIATHQLVEEERRKAEEKLQRRMEKMKAQQRKGRRAGGGGGGGGGVGVPSQSDGGGYMYMIKTKILETFRVLGYVHVHALCSVNRDMTVCSILKLKYTRNVM